MSYADGIGRLQQALNSIAPAATTPTRQVTASDDEAKGSATASPSAKTDHADLSAAGGLIAKALEGSDTRAAKVEALQKAIASGSYQVPSADVADKMIQALLDK